MWDNDHGPLGFHSTQENDAGGCIILKSVNMTWAIFKVYLTHSISSKYDQGSPLNNHFSYMLPWWLYFVLLGTVHDISVSRMLTALCYLLFAFLLAFSAGPFYYLHFYHLSTSLYKVNIGTLFSQGGLLLSLPVSRHYHFYFILVCLFLSFQTSLLGLAMFAISWALCCYSYRGRSYFTFDRQQTLMRRPHSRFI